MGLVLAKAPVPGEVKTRLAATVGPGAAAELAAAALLDTMDACGAAFSDSFLVISGDLAAAVGGDAIAELARGWTVLSQRGSGLAERLANAHADVHAATGAPVVQVGMDTPQVDPVTLRAVGDRLSWRSAVLGPAEAGGWWVLGLAEPAAAQVLGRVPMSTVTTGAATRAALEARGLHVHVAPTLRDVNTAVDAVQVAALAPRTRFAQVWRRVTDSCPSAAASGS